MSDQPGYRGDDGRPVVPVVFIHAFPLHGGLFDAVRDALCRPAPGGVRCQLITPDLRGFGDTPLGTDEPDLAHYADDIAALLDAEGFGSAVIGGVSIGGYVAMELLRRHPNRVAGLILANTKANADTDEAKANRERIAQRLDAEGSARVLVEEVFPGLLGETSKASRPQVVRRVRDLVQAADPAAAAWAQRAMARRPDSLADLRKFSGIPARVIASTEDALSSAEAASAMADALHTQVSTIHRAGHLTPLESPVAFVETVAAVLTHWGQ